ncbi:hypothetical protein [Tsukamurella sp. 1534]|uniref:hypothetical protein n=1 Tax=Tsukamurella sp. 1534 TaxID=1151061 RepID=UPI0002DC9D22|nr:hypothetical protein [Tsukamurella sp. 1534]
MTPTTDSAAPASPTADWIADATRRLASAPPDADTGDGWGDEVLGRLRDSIAGLVAGSPRRGRTFDTAADGVTMSTLALSRALTFELSERAAGEYAAIADVAADVDGSTLTAVRLHVVAIGAEERARTMTEGGDQIRAAAGEVLAEVVPDPSRVRVDLSWDDLFLPDAES